MIKNNANRNSRQSNTLLLILATDTPGLPALDFFLSGMLELRNRFHGQWNTILVEHQYKTYSVTEDFPVHQLVPEWELLYWEYKRHPIAGVHFTDFKNQVRGVICVIVDPLLEENEFIRKAKRESQRRTFYDIMFNVQHIQEHYPKLFILQVCNANAITPLVSVLGEGMYKFLHGNIFYRQCLITEPHKFPLLVQEFISHLSTST
jgi:hypothetical protein